MIDFNNIGKLFIVFGGILLFLGIIFLFINKIPLFGRMPGDIYVKRGNFVFYFPIVSSIILSIVLTIILNLIIRGHK